MVVHVAEREINVGPAAGEEGESAIWLRVSCEVWSISTIASRYA